MGTESAKELITRKILTTVTSARFLAATAAVLGVVQTGLTGVVAWNLAGAEIAGIVVALIVSYGIRPQ